MKNWIPKIRQRFVPRLRGRFNHRCCEHTRARFLYWQVISKHQGYLLASDSSQAYGDAPLWSFDYADWQFEKFNEIARSDIDVKRKTKALKNMANGR